jgi:hypothetical protein
MKRPSFQFYPADWLRDTALRSCSTGARGLWIDMICYMHEGNPYGHLKVGEKVILPVNLARMVGETLEVVEGWLAELKVAGVYDVTDDGAICSRRMIRDENLREIRALGGKKGGNPALVLLGKVNLKDNHKVDNEDKQNPTPSSSSSSSSSIYKEASNYQVVAQDRKRKDTDLKPPDVSQETWSDYLTLRKSKKAPVTASVLKSLRKDASAIGWSLEQVLEAQIKNGWQGFNPEWVASKKETPPAATTLQSVFRGAL